MKLLSRTALTVMLVTLFAGCIKSPYYQKNLAVPQFQWGYDFRPSFKVAITDTNAVYNLYFIIRHTDIYPYSNIWLNIFSKHEKDSSFKESRIEIPLAEPSGKWLGRGMGEIWEQRMPISRDDNPMVFPKPGVYEFRFEQTMRVNPLPEVLQVGLRIEKSGKKR